MFGLWEIRIKGARTNEVWLYTSDIPNSDIHGRNIKSLPGMSDLNCSAIMRSVEPINHMYIPLSVAVPCRRCVCEGGGRGFNPPPQEFLCLSVWNSQMPFRGPCPPPLQEFQDSPLHFYLNNCLWFRGKAIFSIEASFQGALAVFSILWWRRAYNSGREATTILSYITRILFLAWTHIDNHFIKVMGHQTKDGAT